MAQQQPLTQLSLAQVSQLLSGFVQGLLPAQLKLIGCRLIADSADAVWIITRRVVSERNPSFAQTVHLMPQQNAPPLAGRFAFWDWHRYGFRRITSAAKTPSDFGCMRYGGSLG